MLAARFATLMFELRSERRNVQLAASAFGVGMGACAARLTAALLWVAWRQPSAALAVVAALTGIAAARLQAAMRSRDDLAGEARVVLAMLRAVSRGGPRQIDSASQRTSA